MNLFSLKNWYSNGVILLIISLSFSKSIPNLLLGILIVGFAVLLVKEKGIVKNVKQHSIIGLLLLYLVLKSIFEGSLGQDFNLLSRLILVLVVPIVFLPVSPLTIKWGVIIAASIAVFIALIQVSIYYVEFHSIPFSNGEAVNKLLLIERPYMGFLCLLALIICTDLIRTQKKYKYALIFLSLSFGLFIFFIAARLSLITLVSLIFIYFIFYSSFTRLKKGIILSLCLVSISIGFFSNKNLRDRFFVSQNFEILKDNEPRFVIWKCGSEILNSAEFNLVFGAKSFPWVQDQLNQCYADSISKESKKVWFMKTKYNTHNQFLDILLSGGYIGLFLFSFFIFHLLKKAYTDFYLLSIALSLMLFFIMENVIHRQLGCYLVAIIISLIYSDERQKI